MLDLIWNGPEGRGVEDREVAKGRRRGYSKPAEKKRPREEQLQAREEVLRNGVHALAVAWVWDMGSRRWGWSSTAPGEKVERGAMQRLYTSRREEEPQVVSRGEEGVKEDPREATDGRSPAALVVSELFRSIDGRGTDCRLDLGSAHRAKVWPREAIHPGRWRWRVSQAYGWKVSGHINELELEAVILAVKRRMRQRRAIGTRFLHLTDSQVVAGVMGKGRSSSGKLNRKLMVLGGLLLGTHSVGVTGWVKTAENPADRPSRTWRCVRQPGTRKFRRVRV